MIFYNFLIAVLLTFYIVYIITFFNKKQRDSIQKANKKLDIYRKIPIKTLKQQKNFLNIKQPHNKWKFNKKQIIPSILYILMYLFFINLFLYLFKKGGITFNLWTTVLFVILAPLIINWILQRWNLERTDIFTFFRGGKNGNNKR